MNAAGRHALVLAAGEPPTRAGLDAAWPGWDAGVDLVVAADGGARLAAVLDVRLDAWVGDADSLAPAELDALAAAGVAIRRAEAAKDESDAELAVVEAVRRGATRLTILGALGGRLDHALANLALLAHPVLDGRTAVILDDRTRAWLVRAPGDDGRPVRQALPGRPGDVVSLLPVDDVDGVTTEGLAFPLADEPLPAGPARGLSNVRLAADAAVTVRAGRLLVVESPPEHRSDVSSGHVDARGR